MSVLVCLLLAAAPRAQPEVAMSLEGAVVHRPPHVTDRRAFAALAEAVIVLGNPPAEPSQLAKAFAEAAATGRTKLNVSPPVHLLATGPILDGPDRVLPRRLVRRGDQLDLEILHTAVRLQDVPLRRNIIWRPMVRVPLQLPAGSYRLKVTWRAVAALPDGEPLKSPPRVRTVRFTVQVQK